MIKNNKDKKYVICINNHECDDLEFRKVYQVIPDNDADKDGYIRVVDESGEDYLYPESYFVFVDLPNKALEILAQAS
jgi:hypothetical protein